MGCDLTMFAKIAVRFAFSLFGFTLLLITLTPAIGGMNTTQPTASEHGRVLYIEDTPRSLRVSIHPVSVLIRRSEPIWSPDHTHIASHQWDAVTGQRSIVVIDPYRGVQQVYRAPACRDELLTWTPDGQGIIFVRGDMAASNYTPVEQHPQTVMLDLTTGQQFILPHNRTVSQTADGQRVVTAR